METIDSYCEKVVMLNMGSGTIAVLPGGLSREEYVAHLDILISEMYSKLTNYMEWEYRSGYALLQMIRKYCFSKKVFDNLQQDKDFAEYYVKTNSMIDDEMAKFAREPERTFAVIDADKVFTIISNTMQLLTSVIKVRETETEKKSAQVFGVNLPFMVDKQKIVRLARESTAIVDIVPYLDKVNGITDSYEKALISPVGSKTALMEWAEFKYLKTVLDLTKCKLDEIEVF